MIFLDANFLLRYLAVSDLPADRARNQIASDLFERADRGGVEITTSEAVLAEVAFVLTSKNHYRLDVADAAGRIEVVVRLRGMRLPDRGIVLDALNIWMNHPRIGFVDALAASYGQQPGVELATFDAHFNRIASVNRWNPLEE